MNNYPFLLVFIMCLFLSCDQETPSSTSTSQVKTEPKETVSEESVGNEKLIVFFGNSLSAGYGLDPSQGFVGLIASRIDSMQNGYKVINAGLSGETTAGGASRVEWIIENNPPDIFVLELGGNDALRGIEVEESFKNLQSIIDKVKAKNDQVTIVLAGMLAPPNMGPDFSKAFAAIYPRLAEKNDLALIPFLLDKVGGEPDLNLPDGIHPNIEGHKIVTETVWKILAPLL